MPAIGGTVSYKTTFSSLTVRRELPFTFFTSIPLGEALDLLVDGNSKVIFLLFFLNPPADGEKQSFSSTHFHVFQHTSTCSHTRRVSI